MSRDKSGRFTSATADTGATNSSDSNADANAVEEGMVREFFKFLRGLIKDGRKITAVVIFAVAGGIYFLIPRPVVPDSYLPEFVRTLVVKEPDLFPSKMYLWTYDSSDNSIQHKEIALKGSNTFTGKYVYRETANSGVIIGYRRIDGSTIGLEYASDNPDGMGLGYITLRRLKFESESEPSVWIGFETGHDCRCGASMSHEGPFTSLPAILMATPEPPSYLINLVKRAKTINEDFVWPDEIQKAMSAKS
jgi:hypothetical protein